uniref:Gustatory receptor n=1 Tax=Anopheles farauti TaxID=69004 RepID=A0A1Y9H9H3_9DIPT
MEQSLNNTVFKLCGLMPLFSLGGQMWKSMLSICYALSVVTFIVSQQFIIYHIHLERDFSGWFISTSMLFTTFVILVQALLSGKGLQWLRCELLQIEASLSKYTLGKRRYFGAIFYILYVIGIARNIFRTVIMVRLGLRTTGIAILLLSPSLIILARINQQIYLMEFIASHMETILMELTASLEMDGQLTVEEASARQRCGLMLHRTETIFGRLQKCLLMVNTLFGWSTAAIVVFVFVSITFQFRAPMHPLPFYVQMIDVAYSITLLLFLCRSSSHSTERVKDMRRILLQPYYHCSLWDQVHNFIVRTKLQPFEFTANGLYSINYSLFGSVSPEGTFFTVRWQHPPPTLSLCYNLIRKYRNHK